MSEDTSDEEKTEPATPRREQKAQEEGQVVRSRELTTFLLLLAGVGGLWVQGPLLYEQLGTVMEQAFLFDRRQAMEPSSMMVHAGDLGQRAFLSLIPLFLLFGLVALASPMVLGGWSMSAKSLKPQASKLNPLKGLKRQFSSQALAELSKGIVKTTLVGGVMVLFLWTNQGKFMALMAQPVKQALGNALEMAAMVCGLMVLALVAVILIDVPYQLWSHAKKLRMTKEEVKRDHKESEGDPQLKARIRSQQQSMARRRMMSQVPEADVVVTNPSHYAVALRYQEQGMAVPRVVAKGAGPVAERLKQLAEEHNIPLLEAPPLARALYRHVDLDREIPADLYTAVAEVLAWAFRLRHVRKEGGEVAEPGELPIPTALRWDGGEPAATSS